MPDTIGRITIPALVDSGLTFPLTSDYGGGFSQDRQTVIHQFGSVDAKIEQRFAVGLGPRKFRFQRAALNLRDATRLKAFWDQLPTGSVGNQGTQGPWASFTYNVPNPDGTATATKVTFDNAPLSIQYLQHACQVGLTFVEVPDPTAAPTYAVASTCLRFPSTALKSALLSQVQQIIPLVHIRVRESAVSDIYLSDRRCTVGGQLYLPRVIGLGESGSDVIISQDIKGTADNVQFGFGNADRAMTALANDTDLKYAQIDLSLYHANSGILLQLWAGFIIGYAIDGSPTFGVRASDGLYQTTQQYPVSVVSRTCWKPFNDGALCPYAAHGSGGDPSSCDYYFDSANGCQAHGMTKYFGGHPAQQQGVNIKDNSTGTWGIGRSNVTATSIVSDSIWGNALQEIWCNDDGDPGKAFMVKAMVVSGRDESDFYDALGIVGAGPIGSYTGMLVYQNSDGYRYIIAPMLDGQTPHGFQVDSGLNVTKNEPTMGLREVAGNDPCNPATDSFSLGQGTPQVWGPQMAAGTAFVEIRRVDQSGIQASTADSHDMQIPISQGLTGWIWDQAGTRTAVSGLTNPFWIAVNALLRAVGQKGASPATQLAFFVLPSLCVGDGTGTAEIADDQVTPVVGASSTTYYSVTDTGNALNGAQVVKRPDGTYCFQYYDSYYGNLIELQIEDALGAGYVVVGASPITERQFRFQGVLAQQKPFRDWLSEILACALGYFTWEFGKLKLGCRINASATDAFTIGNILLQSLRLEPVEASFEHLVIDFADQAYQYQANTAEYQDKSHAAYYGRSGAPLTARQHLVGCGTLSQALRLAAVRTREEIGGISPTEWRNARDASWKTTILALGTEVGQVVSMTHPDVPGGAGNFRIQSWRLNKDWSIDITAKTVTPSMYDLTVGPKPIDVVPDPLPGLRYPIPLGPAWAPYQVQADAADALFPGEWTFDSSQSYNVLADGSSLANLTVVGKLPVNQFSPGVGAPAVGGVTVHATGGLLPGGLTIRLSLVALDANGVPSTPAAITIVQTPTGTNTNQIVLSDITWPAIAGLAGFVVFASTRDDLICAQQSGNLTAGSGTAYTPSTITINGPFTRSTWALPSPYVDRVRVKAKLLIHAGAAGVQVDGVTANTLTCGGLVDSHSSPVDWTGRVASLIGSPNRSTPFANFNITAFDHITGKLTLDRDPTGIVQVGDAIVIRNKGTSLSGTPTFVASVTDDCYQNATYDYSGMIPGKEVGNLIRVIAGTGRGQAPSQITANTATQLTFQPALLMDTTSVWVVESSAWGFQADSTSINNASPMTPATITVPTANFIQQSMLIAGFTVDVNGVESPDGDGPIREDWVYGAAGKAVPTVSATSDVTLDAEAQNVQADATASAFTITLPPFAQWIGEDITITKMDASANPVNWQTTTGDSFPGFGTSGSIANQGTSLTFTATQA